MSVPWKHSTVYRAMSPCVAARSPNASFSGGAEQREVPAAAS